MGGSVLVRTTGREEAKLICRSAVASLVIVLVSSALVAQVGGRDVYLLEGPDAPEAYLVEDFLLDAMSYYEAAPVEMFEEFCERFSIDPSWPSAKSLPTSVREMRDEYLRRANERSEQIATPIGDDLNEWKWGELGRIFGESHGELVVDGLPWDLSQFLKLVETRTRARFELHSTEPFRNEELAAENRLFWRGLAPTSPEAARMAAERGES